MPTISVFFGIIVRRYCGQREHEPPHVHVYYQGYTAVIDIEKAEITKGDFPSKQTKLALAWVELRKEDLLADWELAKAGELPFKIDPLK
ncbi:MAG: DUF4160 domain-containing protein [Kiritimatiellae bacterium]|nr:DUF4160 domain-containing protein [Kiritimatiellia bacterium]